MSGRKLQAKVWTSVKVHRHSLKSTLATPLESFRMELKLGVFCHATLGQIECSTDVQNLGAIARHTHAISVLQWCVNLVAKVQIQKSSATCKSRNGQPQELI